MHKYFTGKSGEMLRFYGTIALLLVLVTQCHAQIETPGAQKNISKWGYTIGQKQIPVSVIHQNPADFEVYPSHPRLFFRDTDLPEIRRRIKGEFKTEWDEMVRDLESRALNKPAEGFGQDKFLKGWSTGRNMTFLALVTGEDKYIQWSKRWAEALIAAGPVGNDDQYRGRLQSLAVAYDWLYGYWSDSDKQRLQDAILTHIDKNWYFASGADYVGGHSRWGNFALAAGLLSLVTEKPELREKLMVVRNHWINGYHPVQAWICKDGGYHMGWAYSAAYLTGDNHNVWGSATNECTYYPWQAGVPLFWIYGRQGDNLYPNTGDAYTIQNDLNSSRDLLMIAAGVFKDPYAQWMIKPSGDRLPDILYGDKSVKPVAPVASNLPKSKHFTNSGVVIARNAWDDKTTHLQFRSVPFYSANHHHRDENTFTLHYKGALAIDAGLYDEGGPNGGYGRSHWLNYFTRTIAHNGIVVYDPSQTFMIYGKPVSNDGGQTYRKEPKTLDEILPGGHASLGGITHYSSTEDYTYAAGDATKAYEAERVKLAQRDIVYLRNCSRTHPVVVIFDRVESTKSELDKKFILHTVNEPVINGKMSVAENKGGRLSCLTLLPEQSNLQLTGGSGKEFWVDGVNYPIDSEAWVRPGLEPGAWRLEVSPENDNTIDYFLHVLFVDDATAAPVNPAEAVLTKNGNNVEVNVAGWKVNFPYAAGSTASISKLASKK